jgi:hypothetical protein
MPAYGHAQAQRFHTQAADHKRSTRSSAREEHQGGEREEESGRHYQQSSVFHALSDFQEMRSQGF